MRFTDRSAPCVLAAKWLPCWFWCDGRCEYYHGRCCRKLEPMVAVCENGAESSRMGPVVGGPCSIDKAFIRSPPRGDERRKVEQLWPAQRAPRLVLEEAQAMALGSVRGVRNEHMQTLFRALHTRRLLGSNTGFLLRNFVEDTTVGIDSTWAVL